MGRGFSRYEAAFTLGVIVCRLSVYSDEVHHLALFFFLIQVSSDPHELFVPTNKATIHCAVRGVDFKDPALRIDFWGNTQSFGSAALRVCPEEHRETHLGLEL